MSPPLDDGVVKLQAFCDLLESTNPTLESGAADLLRLAQALSASESRLATDAHALDGELDGLQKESESSEAAAATAFGELRSAAEVEVKTELPEVEQQAASAKDEWPKDLDQRGSALARAFQELESDGWSPLSTALETERRDFDRWTQEADAALDRIGHALQTVAQQVERSLGECRSALTDWTAAPFAPFFDHAFWEPAHLQAEKVDTGVVQSFRSEQLQVVQGLAQSYGDLDRMAEGEAQDTRKAVTAKAETMSTAVGDQVHQAMDATDTAVGALEAATIEFESSAIHAEQAEQTAGELVDLGRGIEAAETQLQEIRAAMEAMSQ